MSGEGRQPKAAATANATAPTYEVLTQMPGESLKDFTARFNEMRVQQQAEALSRNMRTIHDLQRRLARAMEH